jgi:hypothetical protein
MYSSVFEFSSVLCLSPTLHNRCRSTSLSGGLDISTSWHPMSTAEQYIILQFWFNDPCSRIKAALHCSLLMIHMFPRHLGINSQVMGNVHSPALPIAWGGKCPYIATSSHQESLHKLHQPSSTSSSFRLHDGSSSSTISGQILSVFTLDPS